MTAEQLAALREELRTQDNDEAKAESLLKEAKWTKSNRSRND